MRRAASPAAAKQLGFLTEESTKKVRTGIARESARWRGESESESGGESEGVSEGEKGGCE